MNDGERAGRGGDANAPDAAGQVSVPDAAAPVPSEAAWREHLHAASSTSERRTLAGLARELAQLPADRARAVLEVSASLAGVSLRVSREFLRAAPAAARSLTAEDLRAWGELGRRLSMADAETGVGFFNAGVAELHDIPAAARALLFQICTRQMALSTSVATETFRRAPAVARALADDALLAALFAVAVEIARRSATHSADFLSATPHVFTHLEGFGADKTTVAHAALRLAEAFAGRAGGVASDLWAALPAAVEQLNAAQARALFDVSEAFLDRGGAVALHVFTAGGEVLRLVPELFTDWVALLHTVAGQGNAGLVALARTSPAVLRALAAPHAEHARVVALTGRVLAATQTVAQVDAEAAISCLRSAPTALRATTVEQFETWAREGLTHKRGEARARRSYYALETRQSNEALKQGGAGLALDAVAPTLRLYVEGLTGRAVEVASLAAVPVEARIGDGRTIHLPASVSEFADDERNFRLYKVLAAHAAGQIEFGTHARADSDDELIVRDLRAAYASLTELYARENVDARDAFALDGYINDPAQSERALSPEEEARRARAKRRKLPPSADYRAVLAVFPIVPLATRIFGTLENGRIDRRLRHTYRGLTRDLELVRAHLREHRPRIANMPSALVPFELLFQITLCGGALEDARAFYGQIVSELETIVAEYLSQPDATVADTLMATSRVYTLFQSVVPEESEQQEQQSDEAGAGEGEQKEGDEQLPQEAPERDEQQTQEQRQQRDARELFSAWANADAQDAEADDLTGAERWTQANVPEQDLEPGEVAYAYDEWDRELADTRVNWCRVVEKKVRRGDRSFVELTRARYRGVISSIRNQFQLLKPESLLRIKNELDGDDYDLDAMINHIADRRADGQQSERLYVKRLRRERDVAVSFLLDQSSSTARTIGRHPLQPYTHPGRRIIEIEKEGLVLMSEALEAVGDVYAIYGFTSEGRRNVKFYVIKDFAERYSDEIERRIGGINYQHNTRLGAAVRHAAARLIQQDARTRLLIVLSDGRPYDHDYGDARYAREDTREALRQARLDGITPFCITIDRDSEAELRDLYGEVGYTIIDDVLSLPERLPAIYRRLTT